MRREAQTLSNTSIRHTESPLKVVFVSGEDIVWNPPGIFFSQDTSCPGRAEAAAGTQRISAFGISGPYQLYPWDEFLCNIQFPAKVCVWVTLGPASSERALCRSRKNKRISFKQCYFSLSLSRIWVWEVLGLDRQARLASQSEVLEAKQWAEEGWETQRWT